MRRLMIVGGLLALLAAVPALALATTGHGKNNRTHKHQQHARALGMRAGLEPARTACRTERAADPAAFTTKYANKKGKRANVRCVRQHVRQARKTCRTERQN